MASPGRTTDGDGLRVTRTGGVRRDVVGALVLLAGVFAARAILRAGEAPPPARPDAPAASAARGSAPGLPATSLASAAAPLLSGVAGARPADAGVDPGAAALGLPATRGGQIRALRKLGIQPTRGKDGKPQLEAAPLIRALNDAGVHEGIGAFPPPGTNPPKRGLVVPDDFELPEGYVRHYQSTDDGEALPPILMFHPDYSFVGADGQPIELPPDLVVPVDLAPPGMPIQMLDLPEPGHSR